MKYKIGDIARLIGLSTESIRQYERIGIVRPEKAEDSAYRYYTPWDLMALATCRHYRALGFSLEDSAALVNKEGRQEVLDGIRQQEDKIEQEIEHQCQMLQAIRMWRREAEATTALIGQYELERNVSTLFLPYQDWQGLSKDRECLQHLSEWLGYVPYVYFALKLPLHGESGFSIGISMAEAAVPYLHPAEYQKLERYEQRLCVHTAAELTLNEACLSGFQQRVSRHLEKEGLRTEEDIFCRCNLLLWNQKEIQGVFDCFVPIL